MKEYREKRNCMCTVDLEAAAANAKVLRSYLDASVQMMAVVKADAYGHGAVEVARHLQPDTAWFAVNDTDEGIQLREAGITRPVLVFGVPEAEVAHHYPEYDLTATVSALHHLQLLPAGTSFHLNFDTGMGRLGLQPAQAPAVRTAVEKHTELRCTGIYSHFATADIPGSKKPGEQLRQFRKLRSHFEEGLLTHMANTAGLAAVPGAHFDMVRAGIGIYGYAPGGVSIPGLQPVMAWETRLVQVHPVRAGQTVSYGATWRAPSDGYVGVIPVGYEDGIPRCLSNQFEVSAGGRRCPVVGTVTMNYCMVALGDTPLPEGTKVKLWGGGAQDAGTWAECTGTIPYEILTGLSPRLPRRYRP